MTISNQIVIEKAKELTEQLNLTENYDFKIEELYKKIQINKEEVYKKAFEVSNVRKKGIKELQKNVNSFLKEVGLESAEFKVNIFTLEKDSEDLFTIKKDKKNIYLSRDGFDDIEFLIITNKGDDFSPLRKSASGGEISRIMLSIKASLSGKDNVPILVFDEIDAGISGRIAGKVGKLLKQLSTAHQIISITHLPQIAALSENHLYVSKKENKNETTTEIKQLNNEEKINEIAKLLSGEKVTTASIRSAKELIQAK